eukprot:1312426-Amphidinium_carterae.1
MMARQPSQFPFLELHEKRLSSLWCIRCRRIGARSKPQLALQFVQYVQQERHSANQASTQGARPRWTSR